MRKREWFRHLTNKDRDRIQALRDEWHSQTSIAKVLGVSKSAVSRELKRNPTRTGRYVATRASQDAEEKRGQAKYPGMKIEDHPILRQYIIGELKKLRSPDEIAGHLKRLGTVPRVGKNAIYKWLYHGAGSPCCRYLCTKRLRKKRQRGTVKSMRIPDRIPLHERPNAPGLIHAERDLFVAPRRYAPHTGLLIVVPDAKFFCGSILPNRESQTVMMAARKHFTCVTVDTCTADNGIENVLHATSGIPTYFCDRGSPWQKPYVEGGIGLVRRWFLPKGTNLATIPDDVFQSQLHLLNGKYRKSLGYRSAYEVALERGIISKIPRLSIAKAVALR